MSPHVRGATMKRPRLREGHSTSAPHGPFDEPLELEGHQSTRDEDVDDEDEEDNDEDEDEEDDVGLVTVLVDLTLRAPHSSSDEALLRHKARSVNHNHHHTPQNAFATGSCVRRMTVQISSSRRGESLWAHLRSCWKR